MQGVVHALHRELQANHVTATHPAYPKYERLLSDGWISDRKVVWTAEVSI